MDTVLEEKATPYQRMGGAEGVRRLVDAFYDAMEQNPAYAELRAMHEPDLSPMRESLAGFFAVFLGGPRDWLEQRGGFCIMSRHAKLNVTGQTALQWLDAMRDALREVGADPELAERIDDRLSQMAMAMAARSE
jgi:hemoglobin